MSRRHFLVTNKVNYFVPKDSARKLTLPVIGGHDDQFFSPGCARTGSCFFCDNLEAMAFSFILLYFFSCALINSSAVVVDSSAIESASFLVCPPPPGQCFGFFCFPSQREIRVGPQ